MPPPVKTSADVVIVGAGLAGLYAAMLLEAQGRDVLVLEGSERIGGRIHTIKVGDADVDLGGTGLGPTHRRALELVKRFDLPTRPLTRRQKTAYSVHGVLMHAEDWADSPANRTVGDEREILPSRLDSYFMQTLLPFYELADWTKLEFRHLDVSFGAHLRDKGVSDEAIALINMCINANDVEKVSALSIFRDAAKWRQVGFDDPKNFDQYGDKLYQPVRVEGGMTRLPEHMAASLKRPVELNRTVSQISHSAGGVEVTCEDGSVVRAGAAIITAPMGVLRRIAFTPALPQPLGEAVAVAQSSANTQYVLSTTSRFWEEDGYAPSLWTDTVFERMFVELDEQDEIDHLRVWINGDNAARLDALDDAVVAQALIETFAKLRPSTAGKLEVVCKLSWGACPLIGGEKYVLGPGEVTRFADCISQPVGALHWAGEHHRSDDQGIEAALQAAERAANEILAGGTKGL